MKVNKRNAIREGLRLSDACFDAVRISYRDKYFLPSPLLVSSLRQGILVVQASCEWYFLALRRLEQTDFHTYLLHRSTNGNY